MSLYSITSKHSQPNISNCHRRVRGVPSSDNTPSCWCAICHKNISRKHFLSTIKIVELARNFVTITALNYAPATSGHSRANWRPIKTWWEFPFETILETLHVFQCQFVFCLLFKWCICCNAFCVLSLQGCYHATIWDPFKLNLKRTKVQNKYFLQYTLLHWLNSTFLFLYANAGIWRKSWILNMV